MSADTPLDRETVLARFDLTGRVAVVTGGSRGIGRSIAEGFAAMGAHVVIASRKPDELAQTADDLAREGRSVVAVPTHVGDPHQIDALVRSTVEHFGGIDIVVNNAANPLALPIADITPEAFAKSLDVNLRGPVLLVQAALPHLRASSHASVVNVVTAGVFTHGAYVSMYVAAKTALLAMTRSMAAEFAPDEIRVNAIAPGTVETQMVLTTPPEFQQLAVDAQLIKRMADPEEILPAALYLASDASSFMTGQVMVVDGGMTTH